MVELNNSLVSSIGIEQQWFLANMLENLLNHATILLGKAYPNLSL